MEIFFPYISQTQNNSDCLLFFTSQMAYTRRKYYKRSNYKRSNYRGTYRRRSYRGRGSLSV